MVLMSIIATIFEVVKTLNQVETDLYSYMCFLKTFAARMILVGCTNALNILKSTILTNQLHQEIHARYSS